MHRHHVWDGIIITVTPTFIFHIERVIELTPCSHAGPSECPGVKGQLQDSLTRQHDLSVIHQLQTFRPKSLKKNDRIRECDRMKRCTQRWEAWVQPPLPSETALPLQSLPQWSPAHPHPATSYLSGHGSVQGCLVRENQCPKRGSWSPPVLNNSVWTCTLLLL